jgi:hypothetical protein
MWPFLFIVAITCCAATAEAAPELETSHASLEPDAASTAAPADSPQSPHSPPSPAGSNQHPHDQSGWSSEGREDHHGDYIRSPPSPSAAHAGSYNPAQASSQPPASEREPASAKEEHADDVSQATADGAGTPFPAAGERQWDGDGNHNDQEPRRSASLGSERQWDGDGDGNRDDQEPMRSASAGDGDDDESLGTGKAAATPEHDAHTQGSIYGDALSEDEYVFDSARPPPFHYDYYRPMTHCPSCQPGRTKYVREGALSASSLEVRLSFPPSGLP